MDPSFATATATEQLTTRDESLAHRTYKNSSFFSSPYQTILRDVHKLFSINIYTYVEWMRDKERETDAHGHTLSSTANGKVKLFRNALSFSFSFSLFSI